MGVSTQSKEDISRSLIFKNMFIHLLTCGFTAFLTYLSFANGMTLFSWHVPLMSFGFFVLMTEAILCFNNKNILTSNLNHKDKVYVHWILQTLAVISITIGYAAIFINKNLHNKPHFHSYHAIFGTATFSSLFLSIIGGVVAKYNWSLKKYIKPVYAKVGHGFGGILSYVLGSITILLGLYTHWFYRNASIWSLYICLMVLIYVFQCTISKPIVCLYTRLKGVY